MNLNDKNLYKYTHTNSHNVCGGHKEQVSNGELDALKGSARLIINQERGRLEYL